MTAEQFNSWLDAMKEAGLIRFKTDAAAALGVSREAVRRFCKEGTKGETMIRTDLACAALLAGQQPYPAGDPTP